MSTYFVAEGVLPATDICWQRECSLLWIFGSRGSDSCRRYLVAEGMLSAVDSVNMIILNTNSGEISEKLLSPLICIGTFYHLLSFTVCLNDPMS